MTNEIQLKTGTITTSEKVKHYFEGIFAAEESGEPFPVNLDDVWPMAYALKQSAVREMSKSQLIEGEDFKRFSQNGELGSRSFVYKLSVKATEHLIARRHKDIFEIYRQCRVAVTKQAKTAVVAANHDDLSLARENAALAKEITVLQRSLLAFKEEKIRALEAELQSARSSTQAPSLPEPPKETPDLNEHWTLTNFCAQFRRQLPMKADAYSKKLGIRAKELNVVRGDLYSYIPHPHRPGEQLKVTTYTYPYWFLDAEIPKNHWSA